MAAWLPLASLTLTWLTSAWAGLDIALLARLTEAVRRRVRRLRAAPDRGLTTVEVAVITAVLLGLATALLVTIAAVVNANKNKIK